MDIAFINVSFPVEKEISYLSGQSLRDYDLIVFDPSFPYLNRIDFSGGGSCIDIASGKLLHSAITHWNEELTEALRAGKTVFVILAEAKTDTVATGYSSPRKGERSYTTRSVCSFDAIPATLKYRNAKGNRCQVADPRFSGISSAIKQFFEYEVLLDEEVRKAAFLTKDRTGVLGKVLGFKELSGVMVLLPNFTFPTKMFHYEDDVWTVEAQQAGRRIVGELVSVSKVLRSNSEKSPAPAWLSGAPVPKRVSEIEELKAQLQAEIDKLSEEQSALEREREYLIGFSSLVYEQGKPLEEFVEKTLILLGYDAQNFEAGDVELDHIIVSPHGFRMIGETEGKDTSAVGIGKFRQLESNITEDFDRDSVEIPAKGILFGNGFRLTRPSERDEQFTDKCLTNAKRTGTALVKTSDLYQVALRVLDNPEDEEFKLRCRMALEECVGEVVQFPIG